MNHKLMQRAIDLAAEGVRNGDGGPFGALVARDDEVLGEGWNRVLRDSDPTAHAEVTAIRTAAQRLGRPHLAGCVLYTSCEPCPMCLAAAYWAHLDRIYYALSGEDAARIGFDDQLILHEIALPSARRRLPAEQFMRDDALSLCSLWEEVGAGRGY